MQLYSEAQLQGRYLMWTRNPLDRNEGQVNDLFDLSGKALVEIIENDLVHKGHHPIILRRIYALRKYSEEFRQGSYWLVMDGFGDGGYKIANLYDLSGRYLTSLLAERLIHESDLKVVISRINALRKNQ